MLLTSVPQRLGNAFPDIPDALGLGAVLRYCAVQYQPLPHYLRKAGVGAQLSLKVLRTSAPAADKYNDDFPPAASIAFCEALKERQAFTYLGGQTCKLQGPRLMPGQPVARPARAFMASLEPLSYVQAPRCSSDPHVLGKLQAWRHRARGCCQRSPPLGRRGSARGSTAINALISRVPV
jgi:hypothetical protein